MPLKFFDINDELIRNKVHSHSNSIFDLRGHGYKIVYKVFCVGFFYKSIRVDKSYIKLNSMAQAWILDP